MTDRDSIFGAAGAPLGGAGIGNGDFTAGAAYTISKPAPDGGGGSGNTGGGPAPDTTPPVITRADMSRTRFAVANGPTATSAVPHGTYFRFTLSERAVVTIRIDRAVLGRRVGRPCLAATRSRRRLPGCTRLVLAGSLTRRLDAGRRSVAFSGRIGRRPLTPGSYRATITGKDNAGHVSRPRTVRFSIVRG